MSQLQSQPQSQSQEEGSASPPRPRQQPIFTTVTRGGSETSVAALVARRTASPSTTMVDEEDEEEDEEEVVKKEKKEKVRTRDKVNSLTLEVKALRRELEAERKARQLLAENLMGQIQQLREQLISNQLRSASNFDEDEPTQIPTTPKHKKKEERKGRRRSILLTKEEVVPLTERSSSRRGLFSSLRIKKEKPTHEGGENDLQTDQSEESIDVYQSESLEGSELMESTGLVDPAADDLPPEALESPHQTKEKDFLPTSLRRWKSNIWKKKEESAASPPSSPSSASDLPSGFVTRRGTMDSGVVEEGTPLRELKSSGSGHSLREMIRKPKKSKDKHRDKDKEREPVESMALESSPQEPTPLKRSPSEATLKDVKKGSRLSRKKSSDETEGKKRSHRRSRSLGAGITELLAAIPIPGTGNLQSSPSAGAIVDPGSVFIKSSTTTANRLKQEITKALKEEDTTQLVKSPCAGYQIETGSDPELFALMGIKNHLSLSDIEGDEPSFKLYFGDKDHTNYVGSDESLGWFLVSIEGIGGKGQTPREAAADEACPLRALIRTKEGTKRATIYGNKRRVKQLRLIIPNIPAKLVKVKDPKLDKELLQYEQKCCDERRNYKFGILYAKDDQLEDEMYGNEHGSPDFNEFLDCMGERITLESWPHYAGGLDVKYNSTGLQSVYTRYEAFFQIMTHVSTLLPYSATDTQQLERKRHIGNDVVVIIFKEGNTPWSPQIMRSHFNYVFCVVSKVPPTETIKEVCVLDPDTEEIVVRPVTPGKTPANTTFYRVAFASKKEVAAFSPHLPAPAVFEKSVDFRNFLIVKLINAERAAMTAPEFSNMLTRTRLELLKAICQKYISV